MFKLRSQGSAPNLLLEILMIVVGINVALWFEGWFEDLQDREIEARYLADLRDDLLMDIDNLDAAIETGEEKVKKAADIVASIDELPDFPAESLAQAIYIPANYRFFEPSDFTWRSMQESGDFRLIQSDAIKKGILRLDRRYRQISTLQANYLQAIDDTYIPLMMETFDIRKMRLTDASLLNDQMFLNFFTYTEQDTGQMVATYRRAREDARQLVKHIDNQSD